MILKLLHAVGLTNLSDADVDKYYETRTGASLLINSLRSGWRWLSNPKNQNTLAFIGGALAAIVGFWHAYPPFPESPKKPDSVITSPPGDVGKKSPPDNPPVLIHPPSRFYIYKDGEELKDGGWLRMPRSVQDNLAISPKPFDGDDFQSAPSGRSMIFYFLFEEVSGQGIDQMEIARLSEVDCLGQWRCKPTYDLSMYSQLVFFAKGESGGEQIRIKAAIFGAQRYGDSSIRPIRSDWITLTRAWERYDVSTAGADLKRVITPFAVTTKARDGHPNGMVKIYIDEIYYE